MSPEQALISMHGLQPKPQWYTVILYINIHFIIKCNYIIDAFDGFFSGVTEKTLLIEIIVHNHIYNVRWPSFNHKNI